MFDSFALHAAEAHQEPVEELPALLAHQLHDDEPLHVGFVHRGEEAHQPDVASEVNRQTLSVLALDGDGGVENLKLGRDVHASIVPRYLMDLIFTKLPIVSRRTLFAFFSTAANEYVRVVIHRCPEPGSDENTAQT